VGEPLNDAQSEKILSVLEHVEYRSGRTMELIQDVLKNQRSILQNQLSILERISTLATQQDLDNALATVDTDFATLQANNQALITYLQSIEPGSPAPDFTPEITKLQTLDAGLQALSSADTAAVPTTPANPVTAPTPTASAADAVKAETL
jgi:hypothetical protein